MRSAQRSLCAAMLALQAVVLALTTPVLVSVTGVGLGVSLGVGLGLTAACVLTAGLLRRRGAYAVGWVIQVCALGLGVLIPMMFLLGAIFTALWTAAYVLGRRIDVERAERAAMEEQWAAEQSEEPNGR